MPTFERKKLVVTFSLSLFSFKLCPECHLPQLLSLNLLYLFLISERRLGQSQHAWRDHLSNRMEKAETWTVDLSCLFAINSLSLHG
jgi:hypothetical protein